MTTQITESKKSTNKKPKSVAFLRDKMREKVRGVFKFDEAPGQTLSFVYREFIEDPITRYDFTDGQIYTIPLGVARHINKNMAYPVHTYMNDEAGNPSMRVGHKVHRATFQSLEFSSMEDFETDVLTAEMV